MPVTGTFSLVSLRDLLPVLPDAPLGDASLSLELASGRVTAPVRVAGALPATLTFRAGAGFAVAALNGRTGTDPSGVVGAAGTRTPAGTFAPPLQLDGAAGWLKYSASADVSEDLRVKAGAARLAGGAGARIVSADYRRHALGDGLVGAVVADLARMRSAAVLEHVRSLPEGDALAVETRGELTGSLSIAWSDVLTSEIGPLTGLLRAASPLAIRVQAGASCSVKVSVSDSFVLAFARPIGGGGSLRVVVKKGEVRDADIRAGAAVTASLADAGAIEAVLDDVVAGVLGTTAGELKALLAGLAARTMTAVDGALARAIVGRLELAGAEAIQQAVDDLRAAAAARIKSLVETKVRAAFAYEYRRVGKDVAVFEADIPPGGPGADLHRELMAGDLSAALARAPAEIAPRRFLNEHTTSVSRAWGFTLGLGKWKVFGQDRRELTTVTRADAANRTMTRSYIGSGGYSRTKLTWAVDFAADLHAWTARPLVRDYELGLHLAWTRDRQTFDAVDLDDALDFAALWRICPEPSLDWLRGQLAGALGRAAEWSFHLRVSDEALRPMLRMFGSMVPRDLAGAAAAALGRQWVPPVSERRRLYAPLWRALLESPDSFNLDTVVRSAQALPGRPALADRERWTADRRIYDAGTVAGIVAYDTDWPDAAGRFLRGCRLLADASDSSAADDGTIPEAYRHLVPFWTESHYVRTLGAALTDAAGILGRSTGVERTLRLSWADHTIVVGSNRPLVAGQSA